MLGEAAVKYFDEGYNCSACVIKACDEVYGLGLDEKCFDMLKGVYGGFGVGAVCSVFAAGVMALGLMFEESKVKGLRLEFLAEAAEKYGGISCPKVRGFMAESGGCRELVYEVCDMLEELMGKAGGFGA